MRRLSLCIIYILLFTAFGCTQKYGVKKSYAFSQTITAGNVPVDHQNRPQTTGVKRAYLIYLEVKNTTSKPQWDTAWIQDAAFSIEPLKITERSRTIGKSAHEHETISLFAKDGYVLWQLLLTPIYPSIPTADANKKPNNYPVILTGTWKGKKVNFRIEELKELERIFME